MKTILEQERTKRHWTQGYVSEQIGITKGALNNIEKNKRKPSYDVLVKLLDLFGYKDPRLLFEAADETQPISPKEYHNRG